MQIHKDVRREVWRDGRLDKFKYDFSAARGGREAGTALRGGRTSRARARSAEV